MANEDRRRLFNAISEAGYDIGLYDEFDKRMNNAEDRKKFFQAVNEAGYDIGDQEEFERRISPSKYKLNIGGNEVPVSEREYMDFMKRNPSGVSKKPVSQPQQPTAEETINNANQTIYQGKQLGNRLAYNEQRAKRMGLSLPQGQYGRVDLGESRNLMEGDKRYNLESGELEPTYITEAGNEYENKAAANIEQQQIDAYNIQRRWENEHPEEALTGRIDSQIADLQQKRDALYKETVERIRQENEPQSGVGKFIHNIFTSDNPNAPGNRDVAMTAALNDPKVAALDVALRDLQDAKTMMQRNKELSKSSDFLGGVGIPFTKDWFNNWKNFGYGVWDAMDDIAFNFSGVNDVQKAGLYLDIKDKIDRGEELTDQETDLALAGMSLAQAEQLADLPTGYTAGETTAEMAPFMLQMATNPASGMGKAFARKAVRKFGREGIEAVAARIAARAAGNLGEAAVLSNTFQAGKTLADISQRYAGSQFAKDEDGNIIMGHYEKGDNGEDIFVEGGDDLATAALKGEAASIIENFTELGAGGSINGMLSKAAASKLGQKIGLGYISNLVSKVGSTPFAKSMKRFMEATHWDGMIEEPLEEEYGIILNSLLTGDNQISDLWDAKQQADIFAGTMWFGGMMAAMNTAVYPFARRNIKRQLNNADVEGELAFGDEWPVMKASIEMMDDSKIPDFLYSIKDDDNFSNEQKAAMFGYASRLKQYQGANVGDMLMRMEGNLTPSEAAIKSAYDLGADIELPGDRKQVVDEATQAEQNLSQYGEEFAKMIANSEDPFDTIDYLLDNREYYSDDQIAAAADYFQKQAMADGMMDAALDNVDLEVRRANNEVISNTHQETGKVINALHDGRPYYVVGGDVLVDPATGDIQLQGTGGAMVVKDAETGETSVMSPAELSVNYAITAENLITANETELRQQLMQQAEDDITYGAPANEEFQMEDTVALSDGQGNIIEGMIVGMPNSVDGMYAVQTADNRVLMMPGDELNRKIIAHNGIEVQRESPQQIENGTNSQLNGENLTENAENGQNYAQNQPENIPNSGNLDNAAGENAPAEDGGQESNQQQSAISRIPVKVDEKGNPFTNKKGKPILDWHKASVEDAAAALVETTGGNMLMARDTANDLYKQGQQKLEKIRKQQPKGDDPIEMAESRMEIQRQVEEQQAINKQWQDVNQLIQRQMREEQQRIEEERKAALTAEQRAAEEAEKARIEEQRRQIDEERRRKKMEEEMANWNKPYAPLAKARKEMAGDPDAAAILNDVEPRSLEEWVSSLLTPKSMMWDDEEIGGRTVAGLQSELGLQKKDVERVGSLVAPSSKGGKPFGQVVHDIWEGLPEGMKNMYNDQDVRNTLIDMFNNIGNALDMRHLAEINRIQEARDMMAENQRRYEEAELEAWAEAMHLTPEERETYNEWMEQAPTEPEAEIINNIIADEQYRIDQREGRQPASRADVSGSTSSQEAVQQAAETADNGNNEERIAKEGQTAQSEQTAADNNVPEAESESVIPKPEVEVRQVNVESLVGAIQKEGKAKLSDHSTPVTIEQPKKEPAKPKLDKADYRTYMTPEAREYFAQDPRFANYVHRELAFIQAAVWDEVNIPVEVLRNEPAILAAEERAAKAEEKGKLTLSDEEKEKHIAHLLDNEHGSAVIKDGKVIDYTGPVRQERKAFIVVGRPAGGKSSVFADPFSNQYGARIIDSDVVKEWLPGYDNGYGAGYVQDASSEIAEMAFDRAIENGDNVVYPKIGGLSVVRRAIELRKKGYDVQLLFNDVPEEASIMRAASRFAMKGRYLSLDYLTTIGDKVSIIFSNFVDRNIGDYERIKEEVQKLLRRPERLPGNTASTREGLRELRINVPGREGTSDKDVQRLVGAGELSAATGQLVVDDNTPIFTHGEWKNNNVPFGTKPETLWNSNDTTFEELLNDNNDAELRRKGLHGERQEASEEAGQASGRAESSGTGSSTQNDRNLSAGSASSVKQHNRLVSDDQMAELKKKLIDKLNNLNSGIDPELMIIGGTYAVGKIERGFTKFVDYATEMVNELGDFIRPYLKAFYETVRQMPGSESYRDQMDSQEFVNNFDVLNFDKGAKVADAITKAEHVVKEQNIKKQAKKIKQEQPDLFAGDLFADMLEPEQKPIGKTSTAEEIKAEEAKVDTNPSEAQKEAGNYQKGHINIDGYDITIENPKGSIRRGTDANGKAWETKMNNTYGYIRGTEGVDGDHIDVFLSDNPASGNVYVIDQVNADGSFDESKCMYGFGSEEEARQAYLSNYSKGWKGLGNITEVSREDFKKWIESSHRKTKPFREYAMNKSKRAASYNEDGVLLANATDADIDRNDAQFYYQGKPVHIMLVTHKGEQVSATKFSEPKIESVTLTNGKNVKVSDLMVKVDEKPAEEPAEVKEETKPKAKPAPMHNNKRNNVGERGVDYAPGTLKARFNANVEAIKIMRALVEDGVEAPTKDQMEALRQYSGWGGMGTYFNDERSEENKILRDLLTDEEYNDAAMSINSAYYTPAMVIDTLWDIAGAMGFKGGNVLEGSAGIGNIIGQMPKDMSRRSNIEAVEIDSISGNILKLLYPDAKVHIQGFQDTMIPNGSVDLAITNVPFVTGLHVIDKVDKDLSRKFKNIHDFCIAKNIRKLREGGIGLFITSSGTLDKSTELRAWITDEGQADVVGAFRLNNETFKGTTVTSDIIVVRKRTNNQKSPSAIDISAASAMRVGSYEDKYGNEHQTTMVVNDYFKEHPEMMAGEMAFGYEKGDTYRPGSYGLYPVDSKDQEKMLNDFSKSMSKAKEILTEPKQDVLEEPDQLTTIKEGRMLIDDKGRLCVSRMGTAVSLQLNDNKIKGKYTKEECFKDYQAVQKAVDETLQQQLSSPDDEALKPKMAALNKAFDNFIKKYGELYKNTAISFLKNDIDYPSFQALVDYKVTKDMKGKETVSQVKMPIFFERVLGFKTEPKPKTVKDALIASIFMNNGINLSWIADKLNDAGVKTPDNGQWTEDDVKNGIIVSRLGFEDPSTGQMVVYYKYLSGNVREKLSIAESYNTDGKYNTNVEELRKVVPMDIPAHLIDFSLGSSWIPMELYQDYLSENYEVNGKLTKVEGSWSLEDRYYRNEKNRAAGVYSEKFRETIYGHQIVMAAFNNRPIKVQKQEKIGWGRDATTRTVTDKEATQACAVRMDEIKDEFRQWVKGKIQENPELSQRLEKIYNEKFNALVPMNVDEEFMPEQFEGANINIHLYDYQRAGVLRGLTAPTMLAHVVGAGKSFTMITTAMEMRRLGTARKPMLVVQNATVAQMAADAKLLYPNAKVLSLQEKDRDAEGRRAFYASIKYNDWDLIIIPQSTFERIPDSPERELQFIQEKIDEKKHVIEAARAAGADSKAMRKLEKELEKIEQEYGDKYLDSDPANGGKSQKRKKKDAKREAAAMDKAETRAKEMLDRATDDVQNFDDLGVDALLVDEAHEYKHLGFQTSIERGIKGVDPSYSKKCAGLYNKTRSIFEKSGWKNVVFATGTPISNTAAEIWTFMKYLMPADVMQQNDIYYFDDFVHNFGAITQMLEFATSGKFKENTRFAAYMNRPELIRIWMQVAHIVNKSDLGTVADKLPKKENGKDQDVFLPQSPSLVNIMAAVRAELERYENMSGKQKKENSHIPLTMYGVAKRAAIDPRLVNADAIDEPMSKTNAAVKEIVKDLKTTKDYKGTVAVFCDNQNRKADDGSVAFNIYEDMKQKLIKAGVPEKQIAIIKSGMSIPAKQKVFDAVNAGDIRVVLGSTQTLGTGVNMQERLHLLIHMDAPDRPMDYTQRNGRIERQGNLHKDWDKPIRIIRFGVEDSLDVTAYQRLKTKSGFIDSIMDGKSALANNQVDRTVEEEEEGLFDNPVAVLSGSQYALLKNKAERELRKYQGKKTQWEADQIYIANALRQYKSINEDAEEKIKSEEKDLADMKRMFPDGKVKTINVEGTDIDMTKGDEAVGQLSKAIKEKINDPVNAIVKRNRENSFYDDETLHFVVKLDGHPVNFDVAVTRSNEWDGSKMRTVIHKFSSYNSPDLHIKAEPSSTSVKDSLDEILDQVVTGIDYQDRIDAMKAAIERRNSEMAQMKEREGKPFEFDKELEAARKQVDEYTELMKKEMEEKEAKYANQQTGKVDLSKAEDSEDDNLYREADTNMFREQDQFAEGQLFPINKETMQSSFNVLGQRAQYSTTLMPDTYSSEQILLDAVRMQYPSYYATIEDGNIKMQSWSTVMAEAKEAQAIKGTKGTESYVERKTRQAIDAINYLARKMHLDVEVLTTTDGLTEKQKRAKGWFNPKTHKIVIVLPNHVNKSDAINTLLHEGVAHYGLRQMFGKNFDTFLDNVYNNADDNIRKAIDASIKKKGWSRHEATEEYLARLAERTDFEHAQESGWWQKIKNFFLEMLAKAGFSTALSDNDLRYILWRSYDNLLHPDSRRNIFDKAKEVQMQSQLRVSQYAERYQPTGLAAERKISEPVEKEYSTIEEAEAIFDDLSRKYNSVPVAVVDKEMSDREIAEKVFGESVKDESDEVISNAMAYLYDAFENKSARYIPDLGKIIIFANATKTRRFEELFFHENLHAIQQEKYGDGVREVAESFWDNAPDEVNGVSKDWVKRKYQHEPEDWKEEFLTYALAKAMVSGDLSEIDRYADIDEFLEEIGYDRQREKEERERSLGEAESREAENKGGLLRRRDEIEDIISKAKADGTYMLAPNGKPTNLNEDQWTMVRTKAFKDWFGDWENDPENASKVVDENGEPKVMYHGTNLTENNGSVAFWKFRPDSHFGTEGQADSRLLVDTWLPALAESLPNKPRTLKRIKKYEVFLNIRNPKRVKDTPQDWIDENEGTFSEWWEKQTDRARYQGYDGVVYLNEYEDREHPADSWIAFNPNQVKSATDNNGEFSTENDDIRYRMVDAAQDIYNEKVAKKSLRFAEAWQDSMIGLKAIQDAIAAETGNVATGAEDAYHFENRMHGRAKNMTEQYDWRFYRPMLKMFADFCKNHNLTQNQGIEYLISKSGLERNVFYAFRNAMKQKVAEDISAEREKIEKDYAKGRIAEATYKQMKKDLEEKERTGVDDEMQKVKELLVYKRALEDYQKGDIDYTEYLRRIEKVINANTNGYYEEAARDFSGLTETFAKAQYDAAQEVKKEAQRAIDPREKRTLWSEYDAMMRDAYTAARQVAEDAVFGAESDISDTNKLWNAINAATKETLKTSYENGLIDRKGYDKVRDMFEFYIPLRGWDENKAADVYTYMGKDNVFSPAVKKTWGRTSKAENPLAYIGNIAVSTILSGHRNMLKQHFLNYVMNNPTNLVSISESWYENIGTEENPMWILRTADTAGKSADEIAQIVNDFNEEMQQKQAAGLAMPVKGRLRLDVNATKGQKSEHVVEVQRAGHTYQLYINGDPKAAQALNGTNSRSVSRISDTYLGRKLTELNRAMAMYFTSKNPAFVISNLSRDLNMAGASVVINEGPEYNARFIANTAKVLTPRLAAGDFSRDGIKAVIGKGKGVTGMMPKLMAKWKSGKLDTSNETERYFKEFMDEGGETGFVNMLSVDSFKEKMKNEIKQMNGSTLFGNNVKETTVGKALRLLGETFEFYNRCAEDATRFIVYMTSRQMGKTLEESIADAKDVTLNFNRKGTGDKGNAEIRDLFIFVNPAIQALANMYRMMTGHPLKFGGVTLGFVAGGIISVIANVWALNLFGDDDDKEAYWNLPPWVRKNNLVMWIPYTDYFVTIPLAQEFRVFYGVGEMIGSYIEEHPHNNTGVEIIESLADLVPINPMGNGGNLIADFTFTGAQPLMQLAFNTDFTGKPIWKKNQGNEYDPYYKKAYVSTPKGMVSISKAINNLTGGNEESQGWLESTAAGAYLNNPAVWNHLLQGYFGGMYNTISKTLDAATSLAQGEVPEMYRIPVANRFLNSPVERDNAGVLGEQYWDLINEHDKFMHDLRAWQKREANGDEEAKKYVNDLLESDEYKRALIIDHYKKLIDVQRKGEKAAVESADRADIKNTISMLRDAMTDELLSIDGGKDPMEAARERFDSAKSFAEKNAIRQRIENILQRGKPKKEIKTRDEEVKKALDFIKNDEEDSHDVNDKYLMLANGSDVEQDAQLKALKKKVNEVVGKYKKLTKENKHQEAAKYREDNQRWFTAERLISTANKQIESQKKMLGHGKDYDMPIMKMIRSRRKWILDNTKDLQEAE